MKPIFDSVSIVILSLGAVLGCATGLVPDRGQLEENEVDNELATEDPGSVKPEVETYQQSELDRALQRLVDDLELAVLGLSGADSEQKTGPGGTHIVQPGEYLDLIIEKTLPNSPIKEGILRQAFVRLNPNAFGGNGNPNYLFAKQKLKIPSVDDLRSIIFKSREMEELKQESREPSRGWIQYP